MKTAKATFGEYFDKQRAKIVKDIQTGKNTELYNAWREDYDKRQRTYEHLKEGVDYLDDIQRNKNK